MPKLSAIVALVAQKISPDYHDAFLSRQYPGSTLNYTLLDPIEPDHSLASQWQQSGREEGDGEGEGLKPEPSGGGADNGPTDTRPDGLAASA